MVSTPSDISRAAAMAGLVAIVVAGTLLRLPGLTDPFGSTMDGWTGAFYSCMARNCLELATPVPYVNPCPADERLVPYVNHPPSVAWLVGISFLLVGESEPAARLPFLICSVLSLFYAYQLGCRLGSRVSGLTAALCLATTPVAVVYGSQVEIIGSHVLLATLGLSLAHFDVYSHDTVRNRLRWGLWTILAVCSDWPLLFLIAVLQVQAWVCHPAKRRTVLAATCCSALCVGLLAMWLMSVDPRFGLAHFCEKIYQRTIRLMTDSQGVAEGRAFSLLELFGRYLWLQWTLFGSSLILPVLGWLALFVHRETRNQSLPISLFAFAAVFYAVGAQGHFQHDFWSHPIAASYALVVAAALQQLQLRPMQTIWLAVLISLANLDTISRYRETEVPRQAGSTVANEHHLLGLLVRDLPRDGSLLVVDASQWPTLPYYLGRNYQTVANFADLRRALNGKRQAVPWQNYLFTHKLVAPSSRHLVIEPKDASAKSRWLVAREEMPSELRLVPIGVSGPWRLYDLTMAAPSNDGVSAPNLAATDKQQPQAAPTPLTGLQQTSSIDTAPPPTVNQLQPPSAFSLSAMFPLLALLALFAVAAARLPSDTALVPKLSHVLARISTHCWLPPAITGITSVAVAVSMTLFTQVPTPTVHDECAYLLSADTFGHGRITNSTHPFWQHFESNHIFHVPAYQAKYPPAQGLVLAAGTRLFGHPIAGVWISLGLATAAVCWALQGWMPGRWALLGGLLVALNPLIAFRWGNTYWGGAVAMLGGALVFGGLMRLLRRPRWPSAAALGTGLALLANSRPLEGFIVSAPALLVLGQSLWFRGDVSWQTKWKQIILPLAIVLIPVCGSMLHYNARLTGSPFRLPYQHHENFYAVAPSVLWQPLRPMPDFRHNSMRRVHADWEVAPYLEQRKTWFALAQWSLWKGEILWVFLLGPILSLPLMAFPATLANRRNRIAVVVLLLLAAVFVSHTYMQPHYAAPATVLLVAVVVQSMRALRTWRWSGWPTGRFLVRGTCLIHFFALGPFLWGHYEYFSRFQDPAQLRECLQFRNPANPGDYLIASAIWRRQLIRELRTIGTGKHLVIVSYGVQHDPLFEWVYNDAEIDASAVVWAHDMGPSANAKLSAYFNDRQNWELRVEGAVPLLTTLGAAGENQSLAANVPHSRPLPSVQKVIP